VRFGEIPLEEAEGAILAHRLVLPDGTLKKGLRLNAGDVARLRACGIRSVVAAVLEPGDVLEDEAAFRIARALAGEHLLADEPFTGRANVLAERAGVLEVDAQALSSLNRIHESITVAAHRSFTALSAGELAATVKIIPFAAPEAAVALAERLAREVPVLRLYPFRPFDARLIQTVLPGTAPKLLEKTVETTRMRLSRLEGRLLSDNHCPHEVEALAEAVAEADSQGFDMLLILGASAVADRRDVAPAAIERVGGRIRRFGIPVDPGNLLLWAELADRPVLVLPGSARSPKLSGVDWMMERLAAGLEPTEAEIAAMGYGGLLGEIPSRPQPRELRPAPGTGHRVAAVVLAAGRSTRMGTANKLVAQIEGKPVVRHVVEALLASRARPVLVVTGHEGERVEAALCHLPVTFVHNPDHAAGMATSLRAGISAVPAECDGALLCLGDMPRLSAPVVDALIEVFHPEDGRAIVVPVFEGQRGHPVLFARAFFPELCALEGDVGARSVIAAHPEAVVEVRVDEPGVLVDVDTPEALRKLGGEVP